MIHFRRESYIQLLPCRVCHDPVNKQDTASRLMSKINKLLNIKHDETTEVFITYVCVYCAVRNISSNPIQIILTFKPSEYLIS